MRQISAMVSASPRRTAAPQRTAADVGWWGFDCGLHFARVLDFVARLLCGAVSGWWFRRRGVVDPDGGKHADYSDEKKIQ